MPNTFSRLIALCGLTQQEAADHLGLAKRTVAMKATDLRTPTDDEIGRLVDLFDRISSGRLTPEDPPGAHERALALVEFGALAPLRRR